MTYCVGVYLEDGLLFASDSRTNAGIDYVTTYSKMHLFTPAPDRLFVLLSAGNLATTQEIINLINRDLENPETTPNLLTAKYLFEVADYIGNISQQVQQQHGPALQQAGVSGEVTLILGGQIGNHPHGLMLIYPQGNHIEASMNTPYLQIGETKYGKPVLDRLVDYNMSINDAARLALVSLTSTAKSNITVGPPFELSMYQTGQFQLRSRCKFDDNGDYMKNLEESWRQGLMQAFGNLPRFEWENKPQQTNQLDNQIPYISQKAT
ncbi:MAG: 20S proteasome subunit A/B [Chromatiales bacterium]|jgi:putative proteasome-type protease